MNDKKIDRLLRSAALSKTDRPIEMPFGFDTRVVALRHDGDDIELAGLARFLGRVAVVAAVVLLVTGAGIYREAARSQENSEPFANEFMIADSAIESEFSP